MSTPDDEEAHARLRALKKERDHSDDLYDRFGDEQFARRSRELAAEIAGMPAHILRADEIETKLQVLTYVVEDYIIARAAQFLPDVDDLWGTVRALPEHDKPETPAETPVVHRLNELRALGASDDAIKAAVLKAASLSSYKDESVHRWLSKTGIPNNSRDYQKMFRRHIRDFMQKGGDSVHSSDQLIRLIEAWRSADTPPANAVTRYYRQVILSAIAVLRKLGMSEADINAIIAEGYKQKR